MLIKVFNKCITLLNKSLTLCESAFIFFMALCLRIIHGSPFPKTHYLIHTMVSASTDVNERIQTKEE